MVGNVMADLLVTSTMVYHVNMGAPIVVNRWG
jgi:hypothetical protein